MPRLTNCQAILVLCLSTVACQNASAQFVKYFAVDFDGFVAGDLVATSSSGTGEAIIRLGVEGPDLTADCVHPFCDGDMAVGIHGALQDVSVTFDGTHTEWGISNASLPGIFLFDSLMAHRPGLLRSDLGEFTYIYTPSQTTFTGNVEFVVPEPSSSLVLFSLLVVILTRLRPEIP